MEIKKGRLFFMEYPTWKKGQHFVTVMVKIDGKKQVIGRIYLVYDSENKKARYYAKDRDGNQIFADTQNLTDLKKKFVEHGKNFSYSIPRHQELDELHLEKSARKNELQELRNKKEEQEKGISR